MYKYYLRFVFTITGRREAGGLTKIQYFSGMTTFKITVDDERAEQHKKLLEDVSYSESIQEDDPAANIINEPEHTYERRKKIPAKIGSQELFKGIKDPSEWQREVRKEWEGDL